MSRVPFNVGYVIETACNTRQINHTRAVLQRVGEDWLEGFD